ncbi:MAG TPA: EthD domain-containing protein [Flavipsychrobacter sp.]|nr:EthD domain-containing protein [Flavipsychrobacter sp.]
MFKLIITVTKKAEMPLNEFIQYYEEKHVPLLCKILPPIDDYKRNYIVPNDPLTSNDTTNEKKENEQDFHVFTELGFLSREKAESFLTAFFSPENHTIISEDEAKFVAPNGVKAYVVKVHQTINA